jgi:hypothetical protein
MSTKTAALTVIVDPDTTAGLLELLQRWHAQLGAMQRCVGAYETFRAITDLREIEDLAQDMQMEISLTQCGILHARSE